VTLEQLLSKGILEYNDVIAEISDYAMKEHDIESDLKKLKEDWQKRSLTFNMRDDESLILIDTEQIK